MATVSSLTAERMLAIEAASVVDGEIVGDNLILTKHDGSQIDAGDVRGPQGDVGPIGTDLSVISNTQVFDVGVDSQIRAGRELSATDFTNMGLSAPIGLWNLSNTNDSSGNGRNLTNKGAVGFSDGISGLATTAARFSGSSSQALYILDTGASDPFRVKTGTIGCWFKSGKRGANQTCVSKRGSASGQWGWQLGAKITNVAIFGCGSTGSNYVYAVGVTDVCDDRWHFIVAVADSSGATLYVDGVAEAFVSIPGSIFGSSEPLNIGGYEGDGSTSTAEPVAGLIDEVFITSEILSPDQIRNLYCVKIAHSLGSVPKRASINVTRKKRGAALSTSDFPSSPLRLYNFSAGSLADAGLNNVTLTASGSPDSVSGVDGSLGNAYKLKSSASSQLISTDTGLPSGLNTRSFGLWVNQSSVGADQALISWGSGSAASANALFLNPSGVVVARTLAGGYTDLNGSFINDGKWHFIVMVEDNAPFDGIKRKMYVDGVCVASDTALGSITLAGANRFRIGQWADGIGGGLPTFDGVVDGVFVCNYALTREDIVALYAKGSQNLPVSPKNAGDHIEAMTSTNLYCVFDTIQPTDQIDMVVA